MNRARRCVISKLVGNADLFVSSSSDRICEHLILSLVNSVHVSNFPMKQSSSDIREAAYSHDMDRLRYFVEDSRVNINEMHPINGLTGTLIHAIKFINSSSITLGRKR